MTATDQPGTQALDPETLTDTQRARRDRILTATMELATEGGFHGVQMRDVADRADVALGTLYRYFPSKIHLLIGTLRQETDTLRANMDRRPPRGETAEERVLDVLHRATRALERNPRFTGAVLRALMTGDADSSEDAATVSENVDHMIIRAIQADGGEPSEDERAIARVLQQVWSSSLMNWLSGRITIDKLRDDLAVASRLLLREQG